MNSQTFNELVIYCCNICKRACMCVCVCVERDVQNKRVTETFSNFHEYLECCSRLAEDRLRSKSSKKDLISWNAVRIVRFPLMFFPPNFTYLCRKSTKERFSLRFSRICSNHTSPYFRFFLETCMCVWNGGTRSKRRGSANKYKAIKVVFWKSVHRLKNISPFEKQVGIFLPSLWPRGS